ncbi:hypothetical protein [Vibrio furnissii]|uniref:hypothetical protein n=1 Tax=Vibrio furnissii TaxID=29494 RepID=UPI003753164D
MYPSQSPIIVSPDSSTSTLQRVNLMDSGLYNEIWLQQMIFNNENLIPFYEIEPDYVGATSVCMELPTRSGRVDCLYVTDTGRLVIVEVKLYRNPESRREVVGQILDYAKDLVSMDYTTLDQSIKRKTQGKSLYQIMKESGSKIPEASFIDATQRNLKKGRFLLLIVGDGIREGAEDIQEFLNQKASMEFTFAMIEMRVFHMNEDQLLVLPQVLHKTDILERRVITIENNVTECSVTLGENTPQQDVQPKTRSDEKGLFNKKFWQGFLDTLHLDDKSQPLPLPSTLSNIYFQLPPSSSIAWITLYKVANKELGCFVRCAKNSTGQELYEQLKDSRSSFEDPLVAQAVWHDDERKITLPKLKLNLNKQENWAQSYKFYETQLNSLISEFRPLLKRISKTSANGAQS